MCRAVGLCVAALVLSLVLLAWALGSRRARSAPDAFTPDAPWAERCAQKNSTPALFEAEALDVLNGRR